jgi:hypothetical protein
MPLPLLGIGGAKGALALGGLIGGSIFSKSRGQKFSRKRVLSPEQQQIQSLFAGRLGDILGDPSAGTEPIRVGMLDKVNRRFEGADDRLQERLSQRGFGRSGQVGTGLKGLEIARQRGLADVESDVSQMILNREGNMLNLAQRFLMPTDIEGSSGGGLGAGIGAGVGAAGSLIGLNKILGMGGSGG